MKNTLICILISIISFTACKYDIENGPSISFLDSSLLLDSIEEDSIISIDYKMFVGSSPIIYTQINNGVSVIVDSSIFVSDSLIINSKYSFFDSKATGSQTIYVLAKDKNDLIAKQQITLFVKALQSPFIEFNNAFLHKDTSVVYASTHTLLFNILEGDRDLDSCFVYQNNELLFAQNTQKLPVINDTLKWTVHYNADSVGVFEIQAKVKDVIGKTNIAEIKIEVE